MNLKAAGIDRTYNAWHNMRARCLRPSHASWSDYGGRGIEICKRWSNYDTFLLDMGSAPPGMTLDRVNNSGNYDPDNCRWATQVTQMRNTRRTRLSVQVAGEIRRLIAEGRGIRSIARQFNVQPQQIRRIRDRDHWAPEQENVTS